MRIASLIVSLLVSSLAFSAPAGLSGKGRMLVNQSEADEISILIEGSSAQALFDTLDKSLEQKPTPPLTTFARRGHDLSCWKQEADPALNQPEVFTCGLNLDVDGIVRPYLVKPDPDAIGGGFLAEGPTLVTPAGPDEVSISIRDGAAKAIYQQLDSNFEQKPTPPLTSFEKKTKHLSCKKWPASRTRPEKFSCGVNCDAQGIAKPFKVKAIPGFGGVGN